MTLSNSKNFHSVEALNQFVLDLLLQTINDNPKASILLSGGSTPKQIYSSFGSLPQQSKLCTFIPSDERRVPVVDPLSKMARSCDAISFSFEGKDRSCKLKI